MDRYKKLMTNSIILSAGNFGSKLVQFLLLPLYTHFLSASEFGIIDIMLTTSSMLLPIVSLSIFEAVFRFVLEQKNMEARISFFTNGLLITILGGVISLFIYPIFSYFDVPFLHYFYIILLLQSLQSLIAQFTRAIEYLKLFAINGILTGIFMGSTNVLFLVFLDLGINGYIWSIILTNIVSIIFLSITTKIHKYISFKKIDFMKIKEMFRFCLPLIPNSFAWWVNNASDRYILLFFLGTCANGVYAIATKIPSLITMLNSIFFQSWQISAIDEYNSTDKHDFYSTTFENYVQFLFLVSSGILIFLKFMPRFVSSDFSDFWKYVPFLLLGVVYSCFAGFFGTTYIAAKSTKGLFNTTVIGAVINTVINIMVIPLIGINGASISTMLSFLCVWVLRIKDTNKFLKIRINFINMINNHIIIYLQIICAFMLEGIFGFGIQMLLFTGNCAVNKTFLQNLFSICFKKIKKVH